MEEIRRIKPNYVKGRNIDNASTLKIYYNNLIVLKPKGKTTLIGGDIKFVKSLENDEDLK